MNEICDFCLEFSSPLVKINDEGLMQITTTVLSTADINCKNVAICLECHNSLSSTCDFIKTAKENNRKINGEVVTKTDNLCQMCITPVMHNAVYLFDHFENAVPYYEIKEMLDYSSLDLDVENHQWPIICSDCWEKLKRCYQFLKKCIENDRVAVILGNSTKESNIPETKIKNQMNKTIKSECDELTVKQEPLGNEFENDSSGMPTEYEKCYSNFTSNVMYLKPEKVEETVEKKLCVELEKLHSPKLVSGKHKDRKKTNPGIRRCHQCAFTTDNKYRYDRHIKTHMTLEEFAKTNTLFACHNCPYRTKHKLSLTRHFKEVHRQAYVCEKCNYETDLESSFKLHLQTQHNNNLVCYNCKQCSYIALTKIKLQQHVRTHNLQNIVLKCGRCDFETREVARMNDHKMCHEHMMVGRLYKCEMCSYQVKKKSSIDRHLLTHFSKKQLSAKLHECGVCHYKSKRKDSLSFHIQKQHGLQRVADK